MTQSVPASIVAAVRSLYEVHPYPRYPLFAKPRWQDGYLTHSSFAATLAADIGGHPVAAFNRPLGRDAVTVLIGGGGEILPYIIRKWEPSDSHIVTVDLSATSIWRAKWRCKWYARSTDFEHADLDQYLARVGPGLFAHVDAYGVLHHMANPSQTLKLISQCLAPGGTVRIMVYNSGARDWIHQIQRAFALLGLDQRSDSDLNTAMHLLNLAAAESPALTHRLSQLGGSTLYNKARFADTFLHPREARLDVCTWLSAIKAAGLEVLGLFDRYAELDDLANPLWQPPSIDDLMPRIADRRFENNFELFLTRPAQGSGPDRNFHGHGRVPLVHFLKAPPHLWFSYRETEAVDFPTRLKIWHAHLRWVLTRKESDMSSLLAMLATPTLQRLVRVGALLPGQISDRGRREVLAQPMTSSMPVPEVPPARLLQGPELHGLITQILNAKGRSSTKFASMIMERLNRAQC